MRIDFDNVPRRKAVLQIASCILGGFLLAPYPVQAASVTVNFGQALQNFPQTGAGPNGSGLGQWFITLGACVPVSGNTTCTLSGNFTGTTAGLTSGTYNLVTTYSGTGSSPIEGTEIAPGSNFFTFTSYPATTTLTLVSSSGTLVVPLVSAGQFATGAGFSFVYDGAPVCSGTPVSPCSAASVSLTPGAMITGTVTGSATFNQTTNPTFNYYFSDFAFSGGYQTTLTYVNYSPQTVACTTNFYGDSGSPVSMPFTDQTSSTRTDTLAPGASIHDITIANLAPPFVQGWAQATCTGPVGASLLYRLYNSSGVAVGEAGVNAETAATTEFATFAQTATGIAYANPSTTQSASVTVEVYNTTGTLLGSHSIILGPLQHGAANVGPLLGLTSFTGFVKITSTLPIISLSLNAEAFPVFSSLPPGDLQSGTALVTP
jgi:hypothetical protein